MLNGLIDFPWRLRKKSEPEIYDVCCPQCGWRKTIELGKVDADSRCIHGEEPAMEIRIGYILNEQEGLKSFLSVISTLYSRER